MELQRKTDGYRKSCTRMIIGILSLSGNTQMPINLWMVKWNVVYWYNGILCGYKEELSTDICYDMNETG